MRSDETFVRVYGVPSAAHAQVHGRVNLIGEHTDYNGGLVLPAAIEPSIQVSIGPSAEEQDIIYSPRFGEPKSVPVGAEPSRDWFDYGIGALRAARASGLLSEPVRVAIESTIPHGAGLSSSAALIVCLLKACARLSNHAIADNDIARLAQSVENDFIGMPCGIMDQMAVAVAPPGQALALDTRDLSYELVPLPNTHHFAVVHSGVMRQLSESRYAERRSECVRAAEALNATYLCHLTEEQRAKAQSLPPPLDRRVQHAIQEQQRVEDAIRAFESRDLEAFGQILNDGHRSLRDDFEVSLPQIDSLVDAAQAAGALGARLTGGGFGGCIVACIANECVSEWRSRIEAEFPDARWIC